MSIKGRNQFSVRSEKYSTMTWSYVCGLCGTNSAFEYFTLKNENCQNKIISGNELNKDTSLTIETDKERTDAHFNFMKKRFLLLK